MVHAAPLKMRMVSRPHPDANRIAGLAVAITLNAALLMLLLVPLRAPPTLPLPGPTTVIQWILPKPKTPPPPPIKVPVVKAPAQAHPMVSQPRPITPQTEPPVIVDRGVQPAVDQPPVAQPPVVGTVGTTPVSGMQLEYAQAPAPVYPRDALREGIEGTVLLQVLVDVDGRPLRVDVQRSSGDRRLDIAARRQVLEHWRFRPAMKDGMPVQAVGLVPIAFNLR